MGKVLVTGADGFIGSHLVETLVSRGYDVRAFILYNSFGTHGWLDHVGKEIKTEIEIFPGDIRDGDSVRQASRDCTKILHLAALISIPYSYRNPESYLDTNIRGTLNVLQAGRYHDVERIIHTSTSEVYGTAVSVPIREIHPLQPQSPYAASKIGADHIALSFFHSFNTPVVVLRPFNTYGPRQSTRAVIPTIISQILDGQKPLKLGALHPTRDFSYVKDTVEGFLKAASTSIEQVKGKVINIGANFEVSVKDTVKIIAETMGVEVEVESEAKRFRPENSEVERLWCDNSKAEQLMGWSPAYSGLSGFKRGLGETIEWFSKPANRRLYNINAYQI